MASKYDQHITLDELKSFLWSAATRLRGQIDAAGYKEYIFPLLFFKRISDVYDEQFFGFVAEGGEDYANMQAQDLVIKIPDGAHWRDVRAVTENVGQKLVQAFIAIEQANPGIEYGGRKIGGLENIFGPKDGWTNKNKMPDHIITSLIEDFSKHNLSLESCPADEMGQAYEYLVGKFADDAGNTAQEFYTNRTVVTLMAEILQPKPNESIYDPTCGSGGMLVKCLDYIRNKGEEWQGVKVFGQELNGLTSSIARMNLYLNGVEDFSIACADTLSAPAFLDGSHLRTFDVVLANPPYSIKTWNREAFAHDKWGRNFLGTPPQGRADYAFIQHILASMDEDKGRCAVLLPHGILNRTEEAEIRAKIVETDCIETIIGLGRNLFYNSGLESCVLICNNAKKAHQEGNVLFVEAEKYVHKQGKFAFLSDEDISTILRAYHSEKDIPGLSCRVDNKEILDSNAGNLNIKLYIKPVTDEVQSNEEKFNTSTISSSIVRLNTLLSIDEDCNSSKGFDIPTTLSIEKKNWKKVRLGDVATEYSERCDNPSESEYDIFIGSNCISQYDFEILRTSPATDVTSAQKLFKKGDYLLVRRSLYGSDFRERAPRATFDGVCSADILTIREISDKIYNGFLIYVLYQKELWDFIIANSTGSLTRRIKWKQLADFEFDLPPLSEQKVLAEKLWAAYRLKESYKKMIEATDKMVKSQFIEMFGFVEDNKRNLPIKKIGDFAECFAGATPSTSHPEYWDNGTIRWMSSGEVHKGHVEDTDARITELGYKNASTKMVPIHSIVIALAGQGKTRGTVAVTEVNLCTNQSLCAIIPNEQVNYTYLYHNLQGRYTELRGLSGDVNGRGGLNLKIIQKIPVIIPPMEKQMKFVAIAEQADKSKSELGEAIKRVESMMKGLINN